MENNLIKRGNVYYAQFGTLMGGKCPYLKPVVVIQNNKGNYFSNDIIVAMLITANDKKEFKNYPTIELFNKKFMINYKDIQTIDQYRLTDLKAHMELDEETTRQLDECLINYLLNNDDNRKGRVQFINFKQDIFEDYEVRGNRPGVVLGYNKRTDEYIMALTTTKDKKYMPTHVKLENGATVFLEHIRTVSADKVDMDTINELNETEMNKLNECLRVSLAL